MRRAAILLLWVGGRGHSRLRPARAGRNARTPTRLGRGGRGSGVRGWGVRG